MVVIDSTSVRVHPGIGSGHLLRGALGLSLVTLLGFGLAYSLVGVGLGRLLFPHTASGSLVERDGRVVGSTLVAQPFVGEGYFQSRPSAAGYDLMALAGSNQARTNPELRARIDAAREAVAAREGVPSARVPGDLVTQSGGAIDPHISPEAALLQVTRVARVRGLDPGAVAAQVRAHAEAPQWGLFGQERVNVLELNLALDAAPPVVR
ncbi:potassium-transporting ATPase subunit KdpC [Pseudoxanthomonas daejeonensis]|uniref:potassium-transporting ATPase subunit KdpC n=1 Tax=Pseudoxanthomonas daejeonensis TaxID=266062 RepID=UPI001F53F8AB|nr:potassium-transporting ATPase subunit KdpC [Pseudoxanthomonas daejeonensis]UNK57753.1 potassium-transporting ATPase subunit KdpC [Pseudoxanthomonas daejeonensis]